MPVGAKQLIGREVEAGQSATLRGHIIKRQRTLNEKHLHSLLARIAELATEKAYRTEAAARKKMELPSDMRSWLRPHRKNKKTRFATASRLTSMKDKSLACDAPHLQCTRTRGTQMKSETIAVQQLFQDRRQYLVPFYQRAYVWNKEDQWERLWSDIQDKAEARLQGGKPVPHFLGAAVLEPQQRHGLIGVETLHIIDGQQRLTTLQYVFAALAIALRERKIPALVSIVESCLRNSNAETMTRPEVEVFKLWPTHRDREAFRRAMDATSRDELRQSFPASFTHGGGLRKIGIDHPPALEAIWFFNEKVMAWVEQQGEAESAIRINALIEAVLRDLNIVSISLGEDDDAQVIFETLNGHGAQLHATDLIRNFIFMRADRENAAAGDLYNTLWSPFETSFWMEEQRRGRLKRPRLEWFMQTSLQAELGEEIDVGRLYVGFRRFALGQKMPVTAADQLRILERYSRHYRQLVTGMGEAPIATFGARVAPWDASTAHALALLIADSNCTADDQKAMFDSIVSYFVRRAVCGLTTKSYNKIFVQQLKQLAAGNLTPAALNASLSKLDGDASRWPRDEEFKKSWLEAGLYPGRLDATQAKMILVELEEGMRSSKTEEPFVLAVDSLDVDHILPTSWFEYWPLPDGTHGKASEVQEALLANFSEHPVSGRLAAIYRREQSKARIGNLTLLHYGVNRALQHHSFQKKRTELFEHSNLHLNRELMFMQAWDENAIDQRGRASFALAKDLWEGPIQ